MWVSAPCCCLLGLHSAPSQEYDKRPVNGSAFVYFGMRLISPYSKGELHWCPHLSIDVLLCAESKALIPYMHSVLDALDIKHGPSHGEVQQCSLSVGVDRVVLMMQVILTESGPCLVEVGARCQGGEGMFIQCSHGCTGESLVAALHCVLCDKLLRCAGYSQVEMTADAYTNPAAFAKYPDCPPLLQHGLTAFLVSYTSGLSVLLCSCWLTSYASWLLLLLLCSVFSSVQARWRKCLTWARSAACALSSSSACCQR